jgi:hypothetical protein
VAVPREENTDADLLSHPARAIEVIARAADAGLVVHEVRITRAAWAVLTRAAVCGVKQGYDTSGVGVGEKRSHTTAAAGAVAAASPIRHRSGADPAPIRHRSGADPAEADVVGRRLDLWHSDPWAEPDGVTRLSQSVAVVVFSGEDERLAGLPAQLRGAGIDTVVVDTKVGGAAHNVRLLSTQARVAEWLTSGAALFLFLGIPCESFSVAHRPQLRSAKRADGLTVPEAWVRYLAKHNALARWSCSLALLAEAQGVAWTIENPADRGEQLSPAFWARMRDHGSLWRFSATVQLAASADTRRATFAQCSVPDGAAVQKYTTLMYSACMEEWLGGLRLCVCHHTTHTEVAHGRDAYGRGRAELAAAYPLGLSRWVAQAVAARRQRVMEAVW